MKIKHFMYLLALVLMINLNACSSDSPEEEIPEVPPQEEPGTDPNAPQGADIVVSPNTLLLKDGLDKYVDNPVEGSTLSLNAGVQASELPEVGRVLLYGGISDKFPLGFLGKVSKVEKTATGYDIETEPASLEETFDKLYVNDTLDIELDDTALAQSRTITPHKDAEGYTGLQARFDIPLGKRLNHIEGWKVGDFSASLDGRVLYGVGLAMKLHCFMDHGQGEGEKPPHRIRLFPENRIRTGRDSQGQPGRRALNLFQRLVEDPHQALYPGRRGGPSCFFGHDALPHRQTVHRDQRRGGLCRRSASQGQVGDKICI